MHQKERKVWSFTGLFTISLINIVVKNINVVVIFQDQVAVQQNALRRSSSGCTPTSKSQLKMFMDGKSAVSSRLKIKKTNHNLICLYFKVCLKLILASASLLTRPALLHLTSEWQWVSDSKIFRSSSRTFIGKIMFIRFPNFRFNPGPVLTGDGPIPMPTLMSQLSASKWPVTGNLDMMLSSSCNHAISSSCNHAIFILV